MVGPCDTVPHSKSDAILQAVSLHQQPRTCSFGRHQRTLLKRPLLGAPKGHLKPGQSAVRLSAEDVAETADQRS